ncbi:MAG: type II CAAX endopeptidase family protein [Rhizomicrobium sp.]|jgi:membrane protease YdiL (CAAX protease family)
MTDAASGMNSPRLEPGALRVFLKALASGIAVFAVGTGTWIALLAQMFRSPTAFPWEVVAMAAVLVGGVAYLRAGAWPRAGRDARRIGLRLNAVSSRALLSAVIAGWSTMIAGFLLYAAHRAAVGLGGESPLALPHVPAPALFATLAMAAIVAGTVEEIAFRGYLQGALERRFGFVPAILVSGMFWALFHTNHSYFAAEAIVWIGIFLAVSTVLGTMTYRTNSVIPGIVTHVGFDAAYFISAGVLQPRIAPLAFVQSLAGPQALQAAAAVAGICALAAWIVFFRSTRRGAGGACGIASLAQ